METDMNNVRDFGAKGDGISKDTAAVQRAIDAGGIVFFPPGEYLCGTLYLKSNGGLHLEAGAVLKASPDREDYNADDFCPQNRVFAPERVSGAHFITAVEQHDIIIEGGGRIDGNRQAFYGDRSQPDCERKNHVHFPWDFDWRPAQMIFFCECDDVAVRDVQMYNAPYWTCFLHGCEHVRIRGVRILNDQRTLNGDGIDIDCCRFVTVSDCVIDAGDDAVTLRGNDAPLKRKRACEYITVTNCVLHSSCNAIRIGVGDGVVRKALFSDVAIHDSGKGICIGSKYSPEHGTRIEDIQFENIIADAEVPVAILTNFWGRSFGPGIRPIRRISFRHIRGTGESGSRIIGFAPGEISDISFEDTVIECIGGEMVDPACRDFHEGSPSPDSVFLAENVDDLRMTGCAVLWSTSHPAWRSGFRAENCRGLRLSDCRWGKNAIVDSKAIE